MTYEHILVDVEDGVAILTLNRPDKLNAMNRKLSRELHDAVKALEADDAIGCIVITGAGDQAFSAGGDINEQREDDRRYTRRAARCDARRPQQLRHHCQRKPTIGMMNGLAFGGAAVLASSLDMRVGCEETQVPLPRRGLWPDQQHLDAAQAGRLADREGAAVLRAHRGGRGSLPHRAAEPSGSAREAAGEDDGDRAHDRRQPSRRGHGHQGAAAAADGRDSNSSTTRNTSTPRT